MRLDHLRLSQSETTRAVKPQGSRVCCLCCIESTRNNWPTLYSSKSNRLIFSPFNKYSYTVLSCHLSINLSKVLWFSDRHLQRQPPRLVTSLSRWHFMLLLRLNNTCVCNAGWAPAGRAKGSTLCLAWHRGGWFSCWGFCRRPSCRSAGLREPEPGSPRRRLLGSSLPATGATLPRWVGLAPRRKPLTCCLSN